MAEQEDLTETENAEGTEQPETVELTVAVPFTPDSPEIYSQRIKRYTILTSEENQQQLGARAYSFLLVFLLIASVGIGVAGYFYGIILLSAAALAFLITLLLWAIFSAFSNATVIKEYLRDCSLELAELADLRADLSTYLHQVDQRTSRYFHCVPQQLLTVYYRLRQIESQLTLTVNQLYYWCDASSKTAALAALQILKNPFKYRDSMAINGGTEYEVALYALPKAVSELTAKFEAELEKLEKELSVVVIEEVSEEVESTATTDE